MHLKVYSHDLLSSSTRRINLDENNPKIPKAKANNAPSAFGARSMIMFRASTHAYPSPNLFKEVIKNI